MPSQFECSMLGANVDEGFFKGWYCRKDDTKNSTCSTHPEHFLPAMLDVKGPFFSFWPEQSLSHNAEHLLKLLHKVMYHKQLHHDMSPQPAWAPPGIWEWMCPVKLPDLVGQPNVEEHEKYEC